MEAPGIQSSFIPHDAGVPLAPRPTSVQSDSRGLSELLVLLSIVLLVASAALGAAVFLYDQYAQSSAASKLDQLKRAKAAFEPSLVQELTRLDDRMNAAQSVLGSHVAPSSFFTALEANTLTTVSFTTLDLDFSEAQHMQLKATGVAQSVNSIALQADFFSKSGVIVSPIFTDISRQADGVHFSMAAEVNPAAISFEHFIAQAQTAAAPATTPATGFMTGTAPQSATTPAPAASQTQATTAPQGSGNGAASDANAHAFRPRTH